MTGGGDRRLATSMQGGGLAAEWAWGVRDWADEFLVRHKML